MKKIIYTTAVLLGVFSGARGQEFNYRGFLNLVGTVDKDRSSFNYSGFDNYLTATISDKLSFTGEIIVQPSGAQSFRVDVDRIHITYEFNNNLKLTAGRFYAPIGYYTTFFYSDHAATMTPSILRPAIIAYEDDGGLLETRGTGIMFTASNLTTLNVSYDLAVTNGLGPNQDDDNTQNKAVTMRLTLNPVEGLKFGAGARFDKLSANATSRRTGNPLGEAMTTNNYSAFAAYNANNFLIMGEYFSIANNSVSRGTVNSQGAFGYIGYTIKKVTPYVQYDYVKVSDDDIFYNTDANESGLDLGIKYAFNYKSVLKSEFHVDAKTFYLQYAISF